MHAGISQEAAQQLPERLTATLARILATDDLEQVRVVTAGAGTGGWLCWGGGEPHRVTKRLLASRHRLFVPTSVPLLPLEAVHSVV